MRSKTEIVVRTLLPIAAGAGFMVALLTGMSAIAELRASGPRVGDIVSFTGLPGLAPENDFRLVAQRPDQTGCILDLSVLAKSGGSLIVESQLVQQHNKFRVHWAGERTAADAANCGTDTDLLLEASDLQMLNSAANGYVISEQHELLFVK